MRTPTHDPRGRAARPTGATARLGSRGLRSALAAVLVAATASGCAAADMTKQRSPYAAVAGARSVTLSVQSWVGAQSNVAVAQYLLEHKLGYHVDTVAVEEIPAWDALSQGRVDAILEDWNHSDQVKRYVEKMHTAVPAGWLGIDGQIGWYVPKYFADRHPDVLDWHHLNRYAKEFATPESGDRGQLMDGSPSYITNDKALVKNLGLDFKVVFAGSEAAQITQMRQDARQHKPFLTYWYRPQWLFTQLPMEQVRLPAYTDACGAKAPADIDCAYPVTPLKKYLNADFARTGGKAAAFLKRFRWTERDQNEVSAMIADRKMAPEDAARAWVRRHPDVWKAWLPR